MALPQIQCQLQDHAKQYDNDEACHNKRNSGKVALPQIQCQLQINHAPTSSHNGSPYVHATGITNFRTSISQIHNYSTSMTLISPSSYLKTIIKYQTSHSIQCTLYERLYPSWMPIILGLNL